MQNSQFMNSTTQAPKQLDADKVDAQRRGLVQQGMADAQAMNTAANMQSTQFFERGGSVSKKPTKADYAAARAYNKSVDKDLVPAIINSRKNIEAALEGSVALKGDGKEFTTPAATSTKDDDTAPIPKRKPDHYEDVRKGESYEIPASFSDEDTRKALDEIAPRKSMKKGGLMKYADGGDVPPGALEEEVADTIDAKLSEGEFVFDAASTRFWGLKKLTEMVRYARQELAELDHEGGIESPEHEAHGMMGKFMQDKMPNDHMYLEKEFGPDFDSDDEEYASGGVVPYSEGGLLDNDTTYARGGLMKKAVRKSQYT